MLLPPKNRRSARLCARFDCSHRPTCCQSAAGGIFGLSPVNIRPGFTPATRGRRAIILTPALSRDRRLFTPESRYKSTSTRISLDRVAGGVSGGQLAVFDSLRRRAASVGLPVYLVGGPVRDAMLNIPLKDLDFVLVGDASALAGELVEELGGEVTVHSRFGTATVEIEGGRVDIVTARRESYPFPGSLPEVSAGSLVDDLARRDFSINAMALPLLGDSPEVIDPHGGIQDLIDKSVRTLHPGSFSDDPTRMLRAVRYQQRLGFMIADNTVSELKEALAGGHADAVSGDRWRHELQLIFDEERAAEMLLSAIGLGVLAALHPALSDGQGLVDLAGESNLGPMDYLAALVATLTAADGEAVNRRLNLPAAWANIVRDTIALRELAPVLSGQPVEVSAVCLALDGLDPDAIAASARASKNPQVAGLLRRYLAEWRLIVPALTGDDLLAMGVPPGPRIGELLRKLHSAKLDGLAGSEEDERALVRQMISLGS